MLGDLHLWHQIILRIFYIGLSSHYITHMIIEFMFNITASNSSCFPSWFSYFKSCLFAATLCISHPRLPMDPMGPPLTSWASIESMSCHEIYEFPRHTWDPWNLWNQDVPMEPVGLYDLNLRLRLSYWPVEVDLARFLGGRKSVL